MTIFGERAASPAAGESAALPDNSAAATDAVTTREMPCRQNFTIYSAITLAN